MACKVHFEKLCLYASDTNKKEVSNGDSIELVNDISNVERALLLLQNQNYLTINESCYETVNGVRTFKNFDTTNPNSCVTFSKDYSNCKLYCLAESQLTNALNDYNFGIIPGNSALTGLGADYASRIVFGENVDEATLTLRANGIAVRKDNLNSDKTKALVEAFEDSKVKNYISTTFGESVVYHFKNLLK
jgi:ABC-type metal ion transport system substrate-binding protein